MLPLLEHYPALREVPRASLGTFPSPVERVALEGGRTLWVKRDDLNAPEAAGNKVRALEFLLGGVGAGDTVLTLGGEGSTHVLATATHAARLGARTVAVRWPQEMHDVARRVAAAAGARCTQVLAAHDPVTALLRVAWMRLTTPRLRYVPIGGSSPLGTLGHVNAALELAAQVRAGVLPCPARVLVPLGSGGTTAGLAVGFGIAGLPVEVVGVRVVPRLVRRRASVLALARRTRRLLSRLVASPLPPPASVRVAHEWYGGAYGRPLAAGTVAERFFAGAPGLALDATYSAKAAAAALAMAREAPGETLFWVTFDARMLATVTRVP